MYTFALLAILASSVVANPVPQAVTSDIAPAATAPAGCSASAPGTYVITIANASSPAKREVAQERSLEPVSLLLRHAVTHKLMRNIACA